MCPWSAGFGQRRFGNFVRTSDTAQVDSVLSADGRRPARPPSNCDPVAAQTRAASDLLHLFIFPLGLLHGFRLHILGSAIEVDEHAPGSKQGGRGNTDRSRVPQQTGIAFHEPNHSDEILDRKCNYDHDEKTREVAADTLRWAEQRAT